MFVNKDCLSQSSEPVRRPALSSVPAHVSARFEQERETPSFILSSLRTLFLALKLQPLHFQQLARSFTHARNLTRAFPTTSALFVRSRAKERKSSPLFSCIPALFCRNGGVGQKFGSALDCQFSLPFPKLEQA